MSAMDLPAGVTQDQALDYFDKKMTTELMRIFLMSVEFRWDSSTSWGSISPQ